MIINSGYLHADYARSLSYVGTPIELTRSKGWILKREIPGSAYFDGVGCYPLFACGDWNGLETDLDSIGGSLVSLAVVTDPFGHYNQSTLLNDFKDIARPYKEHYIIDLHQRPDKFVSGHHLRNARNAAKTLTVEVCANPLAHLDDWTRLYDTLIERHGITGVAKFSREAFALQMGVPGMVAFRAMQGTVTVGMLLWYCQGETGYYHLGAYSPEGYDAKASFVLFWQAIEYFKGLGLNWLSLGAGAGTWGDKNDGLSRFKRGWATGTRTAYFCGRIFEPAIYQDLTLSRKIGQTDYFPAYRAIDGK